MARSNVVPLKRDPEPEDVFFTKAQISIGAHLLYVGRSHQDRWVITRIISHDERSRPVHVHTVKYLSDRVYFRRANAPKSQAERSGTFSYLSYSAIWRVEVFAHQFRR